MRQLIAPLLLLAAVPAQAADQFDLLCQGQRKWTPDGAAEPVTARYHVDAAAGKWCRDDCWETLPLAASSPRLVFKSKPKAPGQDESFDESVAADGSGWTDIYQGPYPPGDYWSIAGQCTVAPFTGLKKAG